MASNELQQPYIEVMAIVLGWTPVGEYDRRVVLLTRERGKISAFARGARKPNSSLSASTDIFAFGTFRLYAGRSSYTIQETSISNYFEFFRTHIEESLVGQYFCEVMDWCTRENNDEAQLLLLTYQSLRALESPHYPNRLVRSIFEIKTVVIEGEFPGLPDTSSQPAEAEGQSTAGQYTPAAVRAIETIVNSPVTKLFSFTLDDTSMTQLATFAARCMDLCFEHHRFRSLEVLHTMGM